MGTMVNVFAEIATLLTDVQITEACHQKNSILLRKIYQQSDFGKFYYAFLYPVDFILRADLKLENPCMDRIIDFIGVFCNTLKRIPNHNSQEESFIEDPLITKLFEHLLEGSRCGSQTIRFRSCQLINKILDHLVGNDISDELCDQVQVLLDRLSDSKSIVVVQAIKALYRLQDLTDPEDKIINGLRDLMNDNNAKVRQVCVEKIAARNDVIGHIVRRTRDVDQNVRLAAFKRLSKLARSLKIKDRRAVLFAGIFETSEKVRSFVFTEFLDSWLELYYNIIALMKSIRLDADEKYIQETMDLYENVLTKFYFKTRSLKELNEVLILTEEKLLPYKELNWETISYWRLYVIFLNQNEDSEKHLANVIPEMVHFGKYIKGYIDYSRDFTEDAFLEKQDIIKQLFLITKTYDFADPSSRQSLNALVDYILKTVDLIDDVTETIVGCLELTMPDPKIRSQFGCEIISDLLFPVNAPPQDLKKQEEKEFMLSKLKVKLNCLQEDQDKAIATAEYMEAERLKCEINDMSLEINKLKDMIYVPPEEEIKRTTNLSIIYRCLDIAWAVLGTVKISKLTPSLRSLKNDLIPEMLIHENEIVRIKALRCYAVCCIYDKPTAQNGIHIFAIPISAYQAGEECDTQTLIVCISAISDLMRIYGADLIAEPNEDQLSESVNEEHQKIFTGGTSLTALIQGLVDLMDDEQFDIQVAACQGLCKLVIDERIHCSRLISRLVIKWCHPYQDEPERKTLRQFIGYILERIPKLSNGSEQLEGAVLITIDTLAKAPRTSPLAAVDIDNIAKFMLALCTVSPKGRRIHSNIALSICNKINQDLNNKMNSIYSKMLLMVDIPDDVMIQEELLGLCEVARENTTERTTLKNLTKFIAKLAETQNSDQSMSETTEEEP